MISITAVAAGTLETGFKFSVVSGIASVGLLSGSAGIIRTFIEEYHEKQEEDYLFPRFEKAGKLTDLVQVLRQQQLWLVIC